MAEGMVRYPAVLKRENNELNEQLVEANAIIACLLGMASGEVRIPSDLLERACASRQSFVRHLDDKAGMLFLPALAIPFYTDVEDGKPEDWDERVAAAAAKGEPEELSADIEF